MQEFEVVLADHQIDKLVKDGVFIRVNYGVKKDGLVFTPNRLWILKRQTVANLITFLSVRPLNFSFIIGKLPSLIAICEGET